MYRLYRTGELAYLNLPGLKIRFQYLLRIPPYLAVVPILSWDSFAPGSSPLSAIT
jgi:hypothetical protein